MKRIILLIGILSIFASCTKDSDFDFNQKKKKFSVEEAKDNFETQAQTLNLAQFFNKGIKTKNNDENLFPEWENATYSKTKRGDAELYMIPLNISDDIVGKMNIKLGYYKTFFHKDQEVKSYLVVKRDAQGNITRFVTTSIGSIDSKHKGDKPHLYSGSRKNFTGFYFISNENGTIEKARFYLKGRVIGLRSEDSNDNNDEHGQIHSKGENHKHEKNTKFSLGFSLISNSGTITKGGGNDGGYTTGEGDEYCFHCHQFVQYIDVYIPGAGTIAVCPDCGLPGMELEACWGIFCSTCGERVDYCICENGGDGDPYGDLDEGDECPLCGRLDCNGNCGGSTGGNNGGGDWQNANKYKYKRSNKDKIIPKVPKRHDSQTYNECLATAVSYVLKFLGFDISSMDIVLTMSQLYSFNLMDGVIDGYTQEQGELLITTYLQVMLENSIEYAIENHFLTVAILNAEDNSEHSVVIVGKTLGGDHIFFDPLRGNLRQYNLDNDIKRTYIVTNK